MTMTQIYILAEVARNLGITTNAVEGVPVRKWEDVCHEKGFIFIRHDEQRMVGKHGLVDRKLPFMVCSRGRDQIGASRTLAGAIKIAKAAA
jgi:hypothetical protein